MMRKSTWFLAFFSFPLFLTPFLASPRLEAVKPAPLPSGAELASQSATGAISATLQTADRLSAQYGSRPPYFGPQFAPGEALTPEQAIHTLPYVIACESRDRSVKIVDSNGYYSYGVAQIQSSTWAGFVKESGLGGDPMVKQDAVRMALWAFENGYLYKWSCARLTHII
jgi:hypothetical protein